MPGFLMIKFPSVGFEKCNHIRIEVVLSITPKLRDSTKLNIFLPGE
jgi:hypothetical protein